MQVLLFSSDTGSRYHMAFVVGCWLFLYISFLYHWRRGWYVRPRFHEEYLICALLSHFEKRNSFVIFQIQKQGFLFILYYITGWQLITNTPSDNWNFRQNGFTAGFNNWISLVLWRHTRLDKENRQILSANIILAVISYTLYYLYITKSFGHSVTMRACISYRGNTEVLESIEKFESFQVKTALNQI